MAYRLLHMITTLLIGSEQCMRHVGLPLLSFIRSKSCSKNRWAAFTQRSRLQGKGEYCSCLFKNGVTWMKSFGFTHSLRISWTNSLYNSTSYLHLHSTNSIGTHMFMYNIFIAEKSGFVFTVWILLWSWCQGYLFAFSCFLVFILLSSSSVNNRIGGIFSLCIRPQPHLSYVRCKFREGTNTIQRKCTASVNIQMFRFF